MKRNSFFFLISAVFFATVPVSAAKNSAYSSNVAPEAAVSFWDAKTADWQASSDAAYKDSLGWLYVTQDMLAAAPQLQAWAQSLKGKFDYCAVIGMGGSSLPVSALNAFNGDKKGYPKLLIVDTSDPDAYLKIEKDINLERTLFIISSKSGATPETLYGYKYFWDKLRAIKGESAGENFVAVTGEGSKLYQDAADKKFLRVFTDRKDFGGAFGAISYSSLVPAAVAGYDINALLSSAKNYLTEVKKDYTLPQSLAGTLASSKRVFLVTDNELKPFAFWLQQIISESLGKDGRGPVPFAVNKIDKKMLSEGDAVVFIGNKPRNIGNVPYFYLPCDGADIGKQFVLWEFTAFSAAQKMGVDPFKQPDAALSKKQTEALLENGIAAPQEAKSSAFGAQPSANIVALLKKEGASAKFAAVMAYTEDNPENSEALADFSKDLQNKIQVPVIASFCPRCLHSLGQVFKGGENDGVFLILMRVVSDLRVPLDKEADMKDLIMAQAYGDFLAMEGKGRKVIFVNVNMPFDQYLKMLSKAL